MNEPDKAYIERLSLLLLTSGGTGRVLPDTRIKYQIINVNIIISHKEAYLLNNSH